MSGDAASVNLEVPSGVQSQLDLANAQLQAEQNRLVSLQQALVSGQGAQYAAVGYNPYTQSPIIGQMVGEILAGQQPDFGTYSKPQGAAPTAVPPPSGARPIDYQLEFQRMGYKNWGSNDDAKARQRVQEQAAWDQQNQGYQNYLAQKLAYDQSGMSSGQFSQNVAQAQFQANLLKQALGTPEQLQAEQGVLKQIGEKIQKAPQLLETLNQQLQTAVGDMPQFLSQLNAQLGQAIQGTPQWQQQYKSANDALINYQNYASKVIAGEVPYDPLITQTLQEQTDATKAQLMKNLGTGWETSTPAIEAMAKNQQYTTAVLENQRRQDITQALSNVNTAAGTVVGLQSAHAADIQNVQQALANQYNTRFANIFGTQQAAGEQLNQYQQDIAGLLTMYNQMQAGRYNAMGQLQGTQGGQQQLGASWANILGGINAQPYQVSYAPLAQLYQQGASVLGQNTLATPGAGASPLAALGIQLGSTALGAGAAYLGGGAGMAASSSLFGTDWSKLMSGTGSQSGTVGGTSPLGTYYSDMRLKDLFVARYDEDGRETIAGIPTYDYRYRWEPDTRRTGVIAQDVKKTHPEAYREIGGYGAVDYDALVKLDRR